MFCHCVNLRDTESRRDCAGESRHKSTCELGAEGRKEPSILHPPINSSWIQNAHLTLSLTGHFCQIKYFTATILFVHFLPPRITKGRFLTQPAENLDVYFLGVSWCFPPSQHLHTHLSFQQVHIAQPLLAALRTLGFDQHGNYLFCFNLWALLVEVLHIFLELIGRSQADQNPLITAECSLSSLGSELW